MYKVSENLLFSALGKNAMHREKVFNHIARVAQIIFFMMLCEENESWTDSKQIVVY